jgi:hypothetical protein
MEANSSSSTASLAAKLAAPTGKDNNILLITLYIASKLLINMIFSATNWDYYNYIRSYNRSIPHITEINGTCQLLFNGKKLYY